MDVKKSYNADLDNKRASGFLLGLVVVLSLFLVTLEFTTRSDDEIDDTELLDDVSQDLEMMPVASHDAMPAQAAAAHRSTAADKVNVVDHPADKEQGGAVTADGAATANMVVLGVNGVTDIQNTMIPPIVLGQEDKPVSFQVVERLPEFPGGMSEFVKWLTKNLKYPVNAQKQKKQGTVLVSFIINKDGSISDRKVVKSAGAELDKEALRVLRLMPKWKPGEYHGKPCRTYFCIPIVFHL